MKGMLKAELFKFKNSLVLWIIIAVITAFCFFSIIMGNYSSAEQVLISIAKDCMVPVLSCAVYGAVILTDDFSNGLLKHYIAGGYKRIFIILAKLIHYIFGCGVLLFVYPLLCTSFTALLYGTNTNFLFVFKDMIVIFFRTFPLYLGIFGLFFLFAVLIKKGAAVTGVSVAASIILGVSTNKLLVNAADLLKFSPVVQIVEVSSGSVTIAYFISVLLSLAALALCVLVCVLKFRKEEL